MAAAMAADSSAQPSESGHFCSGPHETRDAADLRTAHEKHTQDPRGAVPELLWDL